MASEFDLTKSLYKLVIRRLQDQWRSKGQVGGTSGSTRLVAQALGAHQHPFCSHLKTRFKQKFTTKNA